jgi:hypothetical protein
MLGTRKKTPTDKTYDLRYRRAETFNDDGTTLDPPGNWRVIANDMKGVEDIQDTLSNLDAFDPPATYEVQVRLVNGLGPGGWSDSMLLTRG